MLSKPQGLPDTPPTTWRARWAARLFGDVIAQRVQAAVKVVDDRWWQQVTGHAGPQDRPWYELAQAERDAVEAWRTNPIAHNIIRMTTAYVVGRGLRPSSDVPAVAAWLDAFWHHPQNRLPARLPTLCDELALTGELFPILFTNLLDGMTYLRIKPARCIDRVETYPEDLEREIRFHEVGTDDLAGRWWDGTGANPEEPLMLHHAVNRRIGAVRGESDLTPLLPWLRRYSGWLEDRLRLNRYRTAFVWDVTVVGTEADIRAAQARYHTPPLPGSVNVHGPTERWEARRPAIEAHDAAPDGRALRMFLSAGAGMPLHWFGEPEGSTRTTARESALPALQHMATRQQEIVWLLQDLIQKAAQRAAALGHLDLRDAPPDLGLRFAVADLTREDNLALAQAAREIAQALTAMAERGWVDDDTARRWLADLAVEEIPEAAEP